MKNSFLFVFCLLSLSSIAQHKEKIPDVWVNVGAGEWSTALHSKLINFNAGLNTVIAHKHYIGLQYTTGFYKAFIFNPDKIFAQSLYTISYGQREQIAKFVYLTPSIGIGRADYSITRFYQENSNYYSSIFSSLFFKGTGLTMYANYKDQSVCIPVNLDLDFAGRFAGFGIAFNAIIMKYPSFGFSANLLLGKIHWKS